MTGGFGHRDWAISVAGASIPRDLSCSFMVRKTLEPEPNTCEIKVYNLSPATRKVIEGLSLEVTSGGEGRGAAPFRQVGPKVGNIRADIEAGYTGVGRSLIFSGFLRTARTDPDGVDMRTVVQGEDSGQAYWATRVSASFPEGTSHETVARYCAARAGVGEGNLPAVFASGGPVRVYPRGTTLSGSALDELRGVLRGMGVSVSIQDGVVFCTPANRRDIAPTTWVVLSDSTGMIGSPSRTPEGRVRVRSLLRPGLFPGGGVDVRSSVLSGQFSIVSVDYTGDTFGGPWFADIEGV